MSINIVALVGRLVRDPESREVGEHRVCEFSIAVDRQFKKDETDFLRIVCWNKTADFVQTYLTKGRQVAVSGRLEQSRWEDKDGNKRDTVKVVAENVQAIGGIKDDAQPKTKEDEFDPFSE